jgi:ribose transport system substrate-binding protein
MKSMRKCFFAVLCCCIFLSLFASCARKGKEIAGKAKKSIVIGLIAKSQSNPVFQAARVGAEDAAVELGKKYKISIKIDWRTPNEEDAQKQANYIEDLVNIGVDGISISCSDASMVTKAINFAVEHGITVMCFDSDAPESKRFAYHGIDDIECGRRVMKELAEVMGGKGVVAILAGNPNAPNLQKRVQGVKEELKNYPQIKLKGVYYHKETPQDAAAKVEEVQNANPDITGWAMVGGWPLFTDALLKWEPGKVKIVAVDALPAQLPYVEKGIAQVLLAQQVYKWGYRSVEILVDKILFGKEPPAVRDISELIPVTKENVAEFRKNWDIWLR